MTVGLIASLGLFQPPENHDVKTPHPADAATNLDFDPDADFEDVEPLDEELELLEDEVDETCPVDDFERNPAHDEPSIYKIQVGVKTYWVKGSIFTMEPTEICVFSSHGNLVACFGNNGRHVLDTDYVVTQV